MTAKKIWANFSVKDAERTRKFYTQLGFKSNGSNEHPKLASFLFGDTGFVIHFFEQGSQIDEYLNPRKIAFGEIIFTLSAESELEMKEFAEKVRNAGGSIFREAGRDDANYYVLGFADPDGHRFNLLLIEAGM